MIDQVLSLFAFIPHWILSHHLQKELRIKKVLQPTLQQGITTLVKPVFIHKRELPNKRKDCYIDQAQLV